MLGVAEVTAVPCLSNLTRFNMNYFTVAEKYNIITKMLYGYFSQE